MSWIKENFPKFVPKLNAYANGRTAIQYEMLAEEEPWKSQGWMEPACTATVNLPDEDLEADEVIIKSYSENQGLYEEMLKANHIGPAIRWVNSGFIEAPVCKLLLEYSKE